MHMTGVDHWAWSDLAKLLIGSVGHWQFGSAKVNVKTVADGPSEKLRSRFRPVLRCRAEGGRRLKGGGFSRLISAGRDREAAREHGT